MTVDIQYRIDDVVNFNYERKEACTFCSGSGKLMGHDGTSVTCPRCQGVGMFSLVPAVETVEKGTIMNIQIDWRTGEAAPKVVYEIDVAGNMPGGMDNVLKIDQDDILEKVN